MLSKQTCAILKGIGIGVAVGSAAAMTSTKMMSRDTRRCFKKNASKCMKTVSGMLDDVQSMMR